MNANANIPAGSPSQPTTLVMQGPVRVVVDPPGGRFFRIIGRIFWAFIVLMVVASLIQGRHGGLEGSLEEKHHSLTENAENKIAIIKVEGIISGEEGYVKKQIDRVREDSHVRAIVLRVNSPGGTVTGSDYIYHHLKKLVDESKIPIVVSMGGMAASGGYYVATAAGPAPQSVFAEPATWTGSIGVIIPHYDLSGLLERIDVSDDSVASAKFKQIGSPTRKLSPADRAEERAVLQSLVDDSFADFKQKVLDARTALKDNADWQTIVFSGRIFSAKQALQYGLVDQIGFIDDAIGRALQLANLDASRADAVEYVKPTGLAERLFGADSRARPSFDLSSLLNQNAPQAYYLFSWQAILGETLRGE